MGTYAAGLAALIDGLDLDDIILVGHSTGGGEVVRYAARQGGDRVAKIVTAGAVPPIMVKSETNPEGTPIEAFDDIRAAVLADRSQFYQALSAAFFGTNLEGSTISQSARDEFWRQGMLVGLKGAYGCVKAFSETDFPTTSSHSRFRCSSLTMTTTRSSRLPPPLRNPQSWSSTPPSRFIQELRTVSAVRTRRRSTPTCSSSSATEAIPGGNCGPSPGRPATRVSCRVSLDGGDQGERPTLPAPPW